jgi:hypothetical protein
MLQRHLVHVEVQVSQPPFAISQSPLKQFQKFRFSEGRQLKNLRAGDQRRIYEKKRIMRCGSDEPHYSRFNVGQQYVLLRLIKAMYFIDKQDRGLAFVFQSIRRGRKHPPHIGDVGFNAAESLKSALCLTGYDLREGCFACARRAVKNERLNAVGFYGATQELSGRKDVTLPNELGEIVGPHASGQRLVTAVLRAGRLLRFRSGFSCKQIVPRHGRKISAIRVVRKENEREAGGYKSSNSRISEFGFL